MVVTGRLEQRSWETENGEKRSVVEIVADEVGPSLRWATAQVTRNERRGGGDFGGGGGGGGGGWWWWRRQRRSAAAPAVAVAAKPAESTYDDFGEEPF